MDFEETFGGCFALTLLIALIFLVGSCTFDSISDYASGEEEEQEVKTTTAQGFCRLINQNIEYPAVKDFGSPKVVWQLTDHNDIEIYVTNENSHRWICRLADQKPDKKRQQPTVQSETQDVKLPNETEVKHPTKIPIESQHSRKNRVLE